MGQAIGACLILLAAISGYVPPALDLRREGRLNARLLLATYARQIRLIPQAFGIALSGAFRHPWSWDGPIVGWVLMVGCLFLLAVAGVFEIAFGDERKIALLWAPLALLAGIGCGLGLVRDTRKYVDGDDSAGS